MMKKAAAFSSFLMLALPMVAAAQQLQPIRNFIAAVGSILNMLIPVLIAAALVFFFIGLVKYIREPGKTGEAGRAIMTAGLVSLFIMVSVWGIVALAQNALGISGSASISIPRVPVGQ